MKAKFFFYGSLMEHPPFDNFVVKATKAVVRGYLYTFNGFPALVPHKTEENEWVVGKYVEYDFTNDPKELDYMVGSMYRWESSSPNDLAGSPYHLVSLKVRLLENEDVWETAETFIINLSYRDPYEMLKREKIPHGDYLKWRDAQWRR